MAVDMAADLAADLELDDTTRDELAGFFARRFPTAEARARLARTAGLVLEADFEPALLPDGGEGTAASAWIALLARADQRGALSQLADAACAEAPDDKMLAEARRLLRGAPAGPARPGGRSVAFAGAALVFVILGAGGMGAWWMSRAPEKVEVAALARPEEARMDVPVEPPAPEPPPAVAAPVAVVPVEEQPPPVVQPPVEQPPVKPASTPASEAPAPASLAPASTSIAPASTGSASGTCRGAPGVIVGWWYAGTTSPGAQGATISLPSSVNVRDDHPSRDNGYAMRGRVLCWLAAGTSQKLSHAPVDIGQGHWWVPVAGGDL